MALDVHGGEQLVGTHVGRHLVGICLIECMIGCIVCFHCMFAYACDVSQQSLNSQEIMSDYTRSWGHRIWVTCVERGKSKSLVGS